MQRELILGVIFMNIYWDIVCKLLLFFSFTFSLMAEKVETKAQKLKSLESTRLVDSMVFNYNGERVPKALVELNLPIPFSFKNVDMYILSQFHNNILHTEYRHNQDDYYKLGTAWFTKQKSRRQYLRSIPFTRIT